MRTFASEQIAGHAHVCRRTQRERRGQWRGHGPIADRGKEGHFGMQGMRERAARIAGRITIISSPESGTEVRLVVPGKIIYRKTTGDAH